MAKSKMLTAVTMKNLTQRDMDHLSDLQGVSVDAVPLGRGYYVVKLGYTPANLTQESKDDLVDFIRDSIYSYHE